MARAVTHVDPAAAFLVDTLVHGQVKSLDQGQQAAVGSPGAHRDVGGLTALVLTCGRSSHHAVQFGATVAAVHPDGASPRLAQRVQHVIDKGRERLDGTGWRRVVNALASRCGRAGQLGDSEVSHKVSTRMWALG